MLINSRSYIMNGERWIRNWLILSKVGVRLEYLQISAKMPMSMTATLFWMGEQQPMRCAVKLQLFLFYYIEISQLKIKIS
jgi:hypothetical protein